MQSYVQLKQNNTKQYKPIIGIAVKTSTLPQSFDEVLPNSKTRNISEIWYVEKDKYNSHKFIKTLLWQAAKIVEIATELGNTLDSDPTGEKYFIREEPTTDTIADSSQNNLSANFIKEYKNAVHLPIDAEEFVNVVQNERNEDVIG